MMATGQKGQGRDGELQPVLRFGPGWSVATMDLTADEVDNAHDRSLVRLRWKQRL